MADETPVSSPAENEQRKHSDDDKPDESSTPETGEEPTPRTETTNQALGRGECVSPTPSGEDLPEGGLDEIVTSTMEILQFCQKQVDELKLGSNSLSFMLLRVRESLDKYCKDYIPMLNTFLVEADRITADYYAQMCCALPEYGDYMLAIEAEESVNIDLGGAQVSKYELGNIVKNVTDNYHAAASCLKSARMVYKDVNSSVNERRGLICTIGTPMPCWIEMQDVISGLLKNIRQQIFKISAYLNFLKQGELKIGTAPDLKTQNKTSNPPDTSNKTKKQSLKPGETKKSITPDTTKQAEEPLDPATTTNQTETPSDNKKDSLPSDKPEWDSEDDIFDPKRRIRKWNK